MARDRTPQPDKSKAPATIHHDRPAHTRKLERMQARERRHQQWLRNLMERCQDPRAAIHVPAAEVAMRQAEHVVRSFRRTAVRQACTAARAKRKNYYTHTGPQGDVLVPVNKMERIAAIKRLHAERNAAAAAAMGSMDSDDNIDPRRGKGPALRGH